MEASPVVALTLLRQIEKQPHKGVLTNAIKKLNTNYDIIKAISFI